jgi:hypothetical protein
MARPTAEKAPNFKANVNLLSYLNGMAYYKISLFKVYWYNFLRLQHDDFRNVIPILNGRDWTTKSA